MFWENYISLCNKIGKAPNVVAAECGVKSTGTVTGWKNGAMPRDNILLALAKYFDVSVEWLKGETNEKKPTFVSEDRLDKELILKLCRLTPEELDRVDAFVQGLLAAR